MKDGPAEGGLKIVIALNAFKGSLTAWEASNAVEEGLMKGMRTAPEILKLPMADGGDGTVDALVRATGGEVFSKRVTGPLGAPVTAEYGILGDGETAVIEMALASGIALLKDGERAPLSATTYGTGELIKEVLDRDCRRLVIGIGGSATNDGGAGMAEALGVKFLDDDNREIGRGGGALHRLRHIDASGIDRRVFDLKIVIASDVTNPLCGPEGASRVYGPQKGASEEEVEELDRALINYSRVILKDLKKDVKDKPGAGAAGGLGAGLTAFLDAEMRSGIEIVMDAVGFHEALAGASLVITGEGRIDLQTAYGKAPGEIAAVCREMGVPVIAVCGALEDGIDALYDKGFTSFLPIAKAPCTLRYAMENAYPMLSDAARRLSGVLELVRILS